MFVTYCEVFIDKDMLGKMILRPAVNKSLTIQQIYVVFLNGQFNDEKITLP